MTNSELDWFDLGIVRIQVIHSVCEIAILEQSRTDIHMAFLLMDRYTFQLCAVRWRLKEEHGPLKRWGVI